MNKHKWRVFAAAATLIVAGAGVLSWLKANQRLGTPGLKATPIPGSVKMRVSLPERVLDYVSTKVPEDETVTNMLPKDTSFAQRLYKAPDGFEVSANVVLMGMDRTSIHKPEYCLPGQGWTIDRKSVVRIPIGDNPAYQLAVAKWFLHKSVRLRGGGQQEVGGLYVFWFVAHNEETPSHWQRVWWLARDLLRTGTLQRWAYISYFTVCAPGQQEAAFERVRKLIAASVPEFQLPPELAGAAVAARE